MLTFNPVFNNYSKPSTTKVNYFELSVTHGVEATGRAFASSLLYFPCSVCVKPKLWLSMTECEQKIQLEALYLCFCSTVPINKTDQLHT